MHQGQPRSTRQTCPCAAGPGRDRSARAAADPEARARLISAGSGRVATPTSEDPTPAGRSGGPTASEGTAARHAHDPADRAGGPARRAVSRSPGPRTRHPDPGRRRRGQPLRPRGGAGAGGVANHIVTAHCTSSTRAFELLPLLRRGDRVHVRVGRTRGVYEIVRTRFASFRSTESLARQPRYPVVPAWRRPARGSRRRPAPRRGPRRRQLPGRAEELGNPEHRIDKIGVLVGDRSLLTAHDGVVATRLRGRTDVTRRPQCSIVRRTRSSGAGGTAYRRSPNSLTAPSGASLSM
jgi:sortase A